MTTADDLTVLFEAALVRVNLASKDRIVPPDIDAAWPNVRGFLRRVPGHPLHRPGPNGRLDAPDPRELRWAANELRTIVRRLDERLIERGIHAPHKATALDYDADDRRLQRTGRFERLQAAVRQWDRNGRADDPGLAADLASWVVSRAASDKSLREALLDFLEEREG